MAQVAAQQAAQQAAQTEQMMDLFVGFVKGVFWVVAVYLLYKKLNDIRDELRAMRRGEKAGKEIKIIRPPGGFWDSLIGWKG